MAQSSTKSQRISSPVSRPVLRIPGFSNGSKPNLPPLPYPSQKTGLPFLEACARAWQVEPTVSELAQAAIPEKGAFLALANHPFGEMDYVLATLSLMRRRKDLVVVAPAGLADRLAPAGCFVGWNVASHDAVVQRLRTYLEAGRPVLIFPADQPSRFQPRALGVIDSRWSMKWVKFVRSLKVSVLPMHIAAAGHPLLQISERLRPLRGMQAIPEPLRPKQPVKVQIQVGTPIRPKSWQHIQDAARLGRYLRARSYSLNSGLELKPFFRPRFRRSKKPRELAPPVSSEALRAEIEALPKAQCISAQAEFEVYLSTAHQTPLLLRELGRLREYTFRLVGEGTGRSEDLDEYDLYYRHLFLWDKEAGAVAGAYRLGLGDEIVAQYGKKGFYTHSLFRMKKAFLPTLRQSVELGRSFVLPAYQRKRLPLFLLWKGIHSYLQTQPQYRYLIGPVSISNDYATLSKQFIVETIHRYYFDHEMAKMIAPRKRFKPRLRLVQVGDLVDGTSPDLKVADQVLSAIEPERFRLPILLKKYIKQNARILGFNVDPAFNNALDGFMLLDLEKLPEATHQQMQ